MKILACGSRTWDDGDFIEEALFTLDYGAGALLIHGGARGADQLAGEAAEKLGLEVKEMKPDWETHGKKAGVIRNIQMLNEEPDVVIAFWNGKSKGTKHTIMEALRRKVPHVVVLTRDCG